MTRNCYRPRRTGTAGFSLLEALVAIAIFGLALVVAANSLSNHAATAHRAMVRQQLLRTAESTMEGIRGRVLPLTSGRVDLGQEFRGTSDTRIFTSVHVTPRDLHGLFDVSVQAWTQLPGTRESVTLHTMVWRP